MVDKIIDLRPLPESNTPEVFEILDSRGKLSVQKLGARITSLKIDGLVLLGKFRRGDGKFAETHPCTPVFGPDNVGFGLSQHGPARSALWEQVRYEPENGLVVLRYEIEGGSYPSGVVVTQEFKLKDGVFVLTTTHQNNGRVSAPVNFGEHLYWNTEYASWGGVKVNGAKISDAIRGNEVIHLETENDIVIPGFAQIALSQTGLDEAVTWAYKDPNSGSFDKVYFCLEPVEGDPKQGYWGSEKSLIAPGLSRTTRLQIKLISNLGGTS